MTDVNIEVEVPENLELEAEVKEADAVIDKALEVAQVIENAKSSAEERVRYEERHLDNRLDEINRKIDDLFTMMNVVHDTVINAARVTTDAVIDAVEDVIDDVADVADEVEDVAEEVKDFEEIPADVALEIEVPETRKKKVRRWL